jgi:hypothetical protein
MSAIVPVYTSITTDLSNNTVTATGSTLTPSSYTFLELDVSRNAFFSTSGFVYNVVADASNVITSITAVAASNVLYSHVLAQSTAGFSKWTVNTGSGPVLPLSFDYSGNTGSGSTVTGLNKTFYYDTNNANVVLGGAATTLGRHVVLLATQALKVRKLTQTSDEFSVFPPGVVTATATTLATTISTAVTNALNTQVGQDAMFQVFLTANGPFVNTTAGTNYYTGAYDTKFTPMIIAMTLANVPVQVNVYGITRNLTIKSLPLWLNVN